MPLRIIPRLDIKSPNLVKGIRLEGLRKLGAPNTFATRYFDAGADEIFYQDIVASLYQRNSLRGLVEETARDCFVPLTVGGGLRSCEDIHQILRSGADKVSMNTAPVARPELIREAAERFGSQCIVIAVETIRQNDGGWKAFTDNGREHTGLDAYDWACRAVELGAGELLLTSVDHEGTRQGFDYPFIERVCAAVDVPVIAHGGAGSVADIVEVAKLGVDGIAIASLFHYELWSIAECKQALREAGFEVRP